MRICTPKHYLLQQKYTAIPHTKTCDNRFITVIFDNKYDGRSKEMKSPRALDMGWVCCTNNLQKRYLFIYFLDKQLTSCTNMAEQSSLLRFKEERRIRTLPNVEKKNREKGCGFRKVKQGAHDVTDNLPPMKTICRQYAMNDVCV